MMHNLGAVCGVQITHGLTVATATTSLVAVAVSGAAVVVVVISVDVFEQLKI